MSKKAMINVINTFYQVRTIHGNRLKFGGRKFPTYEAARKYAIRMLRPKIGKTSFYPAIGVDGGLKVVRSRG